MSKSNDTVVDAYDQGYRIINGEAISPHSGRARKLQFSNTEPRYYRFNIKGRHGIKPVLVHKLVAYQKYGNKMFEDGIEIRHLDGNSLNNADENVTIGTSQQNRLDMSAETRMNSAIIASTTIRKFSDAEMEEIRNFHNGSYKETMETFDISTKSTLHRILNVEYVTKI